MHPTKRTAHFLYMQYMKWGGSISRYETGHDPAAPQSATVLSLTLGEKDQTPSRAHPNRNVTFVPFGLVLVEKWLVFI